MFPEACEANTPDPALGGQRAPGAPGAPPGPPRSSTMQVAPLSGAALQRQQSSSGTSWDVGTLLFLQEAASPAGLLGRGSVTLAGLMKYKLEAYFESCVRRMTSSPQLLCSLFLLPPSFLESFLWSL